MKKKKFDYEASNAEKIDENGNDMMRTEDEICAAEKFFTDIVWWNRHKVITKEGNTDPEILKKAMEAAEKIEREIGEEQRIPKNDFEWGMISGKLSALRWVLGEHWDDLDT
jgi:hypothetical protein